MAERVLTNAFVSINGVDLSDHVRSVQLPESVDLQDKTAMSNTARARIAGLQDWSLTVEFNQDYAAGSVDATIDPLRAGTEVAIIVRPDAGAVAATNPQWTGNAILESYDPVAGSVGDVQVATATFQGSDGSPLTRAT